MFQEYFVIDYIVDAQMWGLVVVSRFVFYSESAVFIKSSSKIIAGGQHIGHTYKTNVLDTEKKLQLR